MKIIGKIFLTFKAYLNRGSARSIITKKNIALSSFLKVINIAIQFLLVPLLLDYLTPLKYGIWLTAGTVINWFYFFDIGLGNGLRNKLAEALAKNEKENARVYISTSYTILTIIMAILYLLFLLVNRYINWTAIFNAPNNLTDELNALVIFVFTFFAINFVARLIGSILNADQKSSINDLIYTAGNILTIIIIYILTKISSGSLVYVGVTIGFATFLPAVIATYIFFNKYYSQFKPSFSFVKFKNINELTSLGVKFFIMQIAVVVVFSTDNLIITQLFGPAEVTPYNIALKYFSIVQIGFSIIISPFWSAFTEAFVKDDLSWINRKIRQLIRIWFVIILIVAIMVLCSNYFYTIWVGKDVTIPFSLSLLMALFVVISIWNSIFAIFINGTGKIKMQMYYGIIAMVINVPLSIFYAKTLNMGVSGIILGTSSSLIFGFILGPVQYMKIIKKKAKGIWDA